LSVAVGEDAATSTTGLDQDHLESEVTPDVGAAGVGLVAASPV
jgi:hypothetical protein